MLNTEEIPYVAGSQIPPRTYRLASQQVPIQGIVVDNGNGTVDVYVYQGVSPTGNPYVVKAGWARGFSFSGTSAVYVAFPAIPATAGSVNITVTDEPRTAFSTQEVTALASFLSDYPQGATPFNGSAATALTGLNAAIIVAPLPTLAPGQSVYLTSLVTSGFDRQPSIVWGVEWIGIQTFFYNYGDVNITFDPPFQFFGSPGGPSSIGVGYFVSAGNTPVLPMDITVILGGYVL